MRTDRKPIPPAGVSAVMNGQLEWLVILAVSVGVMLYGAYTIVNLGSFLAELVHR